MKRTLNGPVSALFQHEKLKEKGVLRIANG